MDSNSDPKPEKVATKQEGTNNESAPIESKAVENKGFLDYLKESSPEYPEALGNDEAKNADTVRVTNKDIHNGNSSNLSDLFAPPAPAPPATKGTNEVESPTKLPPRNTVGKPPISPLPKPAHSRVRSVSFDHNTYFKPETTSTSNPSGDQSGGDSFKNLQNAFRGLQRETSNRHMYVPSDKTLTIDDLIAAGPYELEAEAHLLKAIEEHQNKTAHNRFRSESSSIFSNVPEGLAHSFDEEEREKDAAESDQNRSNRDDYPTPKETFSDDRGSNESSSSQTRPLLTKQRRHRRLMSVEDRLAGLTAAMKVIDKKDRKGGDVLGGTLLTTNDYTTASAGEQLGHNAAQIMGEVEYGSKHSRSQTQEWLQPVTEEEPDVTGVSNSSGSQDIEAQDLTDTTSPKPSLRPTQNQADPNPNGRRGRLSFAKSRRFSGAADKFKEDLEIWQSFFSPRKEHVVYYIKNVTFYFIIPLVGVAAILFYFGKNPPTGKSEDGSTGDKPSASWCLLFCVRQVVTFSLALAMQLVIIDFLCIGTRFVLRLVGPLLTLLLVQSKGWPFVVMWWSIFNFCLSYGSNPFSKHWGYWQDAVGLFNDANPSGHVVDSLWNTRILAIGLTVSIATTFKRFLIGLYLGRQTFGHYGEQLALVMNKLLLVSEVAQLARRLERFGSRASMVDRRMPKLPFDRESFYGTGAMPQTDDESTIASSFKAAETEYVIDPNNRNPLTGSLKDSEKQKIASLLERWEEPDRNRPGHDEDISISSVLRFRNALGLIRNDYPFSYAFGPAYSREACIESAQEVYKRLLAINPPDKPYLHFDTIAVLALEDGVLDQQKAKDLIKVFRPDREGGLTLLDFVKSTDAVYKEFRLLQASIQNSSQIDRAFENLFNILFYAVVITIITSQFGFDPLALFLSLSSVILAFAFMIGSASSKYFEGLLFILVRRPYGIGDMIHVSNVEQDTQVELGSPCWIVQNVTLFETTLTWLPTMERASLSNGSLASCRIINWARSPNARFNITLTFPIETRYETVEIFKRAIEEYIKVRPREWLALNGFRVNRIATEQAFMQVILTVQHRERWQSVGQILDSRANMISYCNEIQKLLGMQYRAPALPIDFKNVRPGVLDGNISSAGDLDESEKGKLDDEAQEAQFQQFRNMAQSKYKIFL